ncbi:MAG: cell envelope integrity protein CreD [Candidatus Thiodiazotropha sp. (ex Semelilucina semeliformis)]|nr:cell envelope integrity protein CreD [Candidatus Thiodiazotropha sp. (ex Myrtea spinifera)]MCU7808052.1 cell envelope integrity protein CreD [Candidatus Thiodiazotropha sp. (ex Semelilucina semeliformis)]
MKRVLSKKLWVIGLLMVLLMIPLTLIDQVVYERSSYRNEARESIAQSWTAEQQLVGPLLVIPYKAHFKQKVWNTNQQGYRLEDRFHEKKLYLTPEQLTISGDVTTDSRKRGIYSVPVYNSKLAASGSFDMGQLALFEKSSEHRIEWLPGYLAVMVRDVRGVEAQPLLQWQGREYEFLSDTQVEGMRNGMHAPLGKVHEIKEPAAFSFELQLHGMEQLQFSPVGKNTRVVLKADWPDPSFIGRYLPTERTIDDAGFTASWQISSFSSGMPQLISECQTGNCNALVSDVFGVRLFNSVDIYQLSERSVKYALLFIGLTFVCFFLFEIMKGLRLHPMQYLLVGLGLSIFYLLLISLSEHMAFATAYLTATLASTLLIGYYISHVIHSFKLGGSITLGLLLLYAMLYGILHSEDNALLMGSLLIFSILGLVMVATRRIDWYVISEKMANSAPAQTDIRIEAASQTP